mgnify:CR=1 FL=1
MPIWEQDSVQCAPAAHVKHSERGEQNASIWGCPSPGLLQHGHCQPTLRGAAAQLQALNGHFLPLAIILHETANYRPAASIWCSYYPHNSCCR